MKPMATRRVWSASLGQYMRIRAYGSGRGRPILGFPTSAGDEGEYEYVGFLRGFEQALSDESITLYTLPTVDQEALLDNRKAPLERVKRLAAYSAFVHSELLPEVRGSLTADMSFGVVGCEMGAYHAVNTLARYPQDVTHCWAFSGDYDVARFMDRDFEGHDFWFHNPLHFLQAPNSRDRAALRRCEVRLFVARGQEADERLSYELCGLFRNADASCKVDNSGIIGEDRWACWSYLMDTALAGSSSKAET